MYVGSVKLDLGLVWLYKRDSSTIPRGIRKAPLGLIKNGRTNDWLRSCRRCRCLECVFFFLGGFCGQTNRSARVKRIRVRTRIYILLFYLVFFFYLPLTNLDKMVSEKTYSSKCEQPTTYSTVGSCDVFFLSELQTRLFQFGFDC